MDAAALVENGEVIGYAAAGVLALIGVGIVQLMRRRGDVRKAREAVRLVAYSIADPRPGPVAVKGVWQEDADGLNWIDCGGHTVVIAGEPDVKRGTRARWKKGARTYLVRQGDPVIAIGVMSKLSDNKEWSIAASPGESGVQIYAATPKPAPPPLFPWRAPLLLGVCGAIAFFGLWGVGTLVVDVRRDCGEASVMRLQIGSALPLVREQALTALARCGK
jgi:hypothetical protein